MALVAEHCLLSDSDFGNGRPTIMYTIHTLVKRKTEYNETQRETNEKTKKKKSDERTNAHSTEMKIFPRFALRCAYITCKLYITKWFFHYFQSHSWSIFTLCLRIHDSLVSPIANEIVVEYNTIALFLSIYPSLSFLVILLLCIRIRSWPFSTVVMLLLLLVFWLILFRVFVVEV